MRSSSRHNIDEEAAYLDNAILESIIQDLEGEDGSEDHGWGSTYYMYTLAEVQDRLIMTPGGTEQFDNYVINTVSRRNVMISILDIFENRSTITAEDRKMLDRAYTEFPDIRSDISRIESLSGEALTEAREQFLLDMRVFLHLSKDVMNFDADDIKKFHKLCGK